MRHGKIFCYSDKIFAFFCRYFMDHCKLKHSYLIQKRVFIYSGILLTLQVGG